MNDFTIGHVRTYVPVVVGYVVTYVATNWGIIISEDTSRSVSLAILSAIAVAYYAVIRRLGKKYPMVEKMLGAANQPGYTE